MLKQPRIITLILILSAQFAVLTPCRADYPISSEIAPYCIYHPEPAWWAQARRGMHGKVILQLIINKKTGEVDQVKTLQRSRFQELDAACILTAFKWKFKPNTLSTVTVPFELALQGYYKEIH